MDWLWVQQAFAISLRIVAFLLALLVLPVFSFDAKAEYWRSGMPPLGSGNYIDCADGIACARAQQSAFYAPDFIPRDCYYLYNNNGAKVGARCDGWNNEITKFARPGVSDLYCESGEYRTAAGCVTAPPDDKDDPKGPQNPNSCQASAQNQSNRAAGNNNPLNTRVANPVDTRNGRKVADALDFTTEGDAPLKFERYYTSDTDYLFGPFGPTRLGLGWRSNFDSSAFFVGNPTTYLAYVHFVMPSGKTYTFEPSSSTFYQVYFRWDYKFYVTGYQSNDVARLFHDTTNAHFELITPDETVWVYDYDGKLLQIRYLGGYTQDLTYDGDGNNTLVQDSFGRQLTFTYTAQGLLASMTVPGSKTYLYDHVGRYDAANFTGVDADAIGKRWWALQYVTYPDSTPSPSDNPKIQYHYENSSFPYALTGITDEKGVRFATWTYGSDGRVSASEHAGSVDTYSFSYNDSARTTTVTNPLGKQTVYHFTGDTRDLNRLTQIEGLASTHCPADNQTFTYDSNNFFNQVTDGEGRVTRYVNDSRGLPTSITRGYGTPDAVTATITWHSTYFLPTQIVEPGRTIDLTYNSSRQLITRTETDTTTHTVPYSTNGQTRTWTYTYNSAGLLLTIDGPLSGTGDTVTYTYDSNGFLATFTDEVGLLTQVTAVNGKGQPTTIVDPNSVTITLAYDDRDRLITVTQNPGGSQAVTSIEYDLVGQITKITRPDGPYLTFTYSNARRLTAIGNNLNETISFTHDNMGNVTQQTITNGSSSLVYQVDQTFDELGRILQQVGYSSHTWAFAWDKTDLLTTITDPRSNAATRGYDTLARLISETDHAGKAMIYTRDARDLITSVTDPRSLITSYVRNGFGDVIQETSPDTGVTVYVRDARGLPTSINDARGIETQLSYDLSGRLTAKAYPVSTGENVTFTYDSVSGSNKGKGRLTGAGDQTGSTAFVYNALGQVTAENRVIGGQTYNVGYSYDPAGNITEMVYPSGRIVTYSRDALGRISGITTKKDGSSSSVTIASSVTYMPHGPLQSLAYSNGLTLWKTFNSDYSLGQLLVQDLSTSTDLINRSHSNGDGLNLTHIWDGLNSANDQSFWYTAAWRLQNADGPWGQFVYSYDDNGNRTYEVLTQGSTTTEWAAWYPSASNRISGIAENSVVNRLFSHDDAGNISYDERGGTMYAYAYNARGRLSNLTIGGAQRGAYVYDAFERLSIRTVTSGSSTTIHTVQDRGGRIIVEATGAGATTREYIWLDDMPVAVIADVDTMTPKLWFVHADHLDRPILMTDGAKASVWEAVWKPWGAPHSITGTASLDMRFPGQWFQAESGLHYNWHRQYDPTTGRYAQADLLGFIDGPNRYSYALNNPQVFIDSRGEFVWIPFIAAGLTAALWPDTANAPGLDESTIPSSPLAPYIAGATAGFGAAGGLFCAAGREISIGQTWRIALGGNRTSNRYGRWPHYHRKGMGDGQGKSRHRPWESKATDRSFWDRF